MSANYAHMSLLIRASEYWRRSERRMDYRHGCRCDECITVYVEDKIAKEEACEVSAAG